MGKLFRYDSPVMQKLAMVGNLVVLNLLWILCSLPVFTLGAATAAMHTVIFQYITDTEDAVFKPFFRAFGKCFRQATVFWIPVLLVSLLLSWNLLYFAGLEGGGSNFFFALFLVLGAILVILLTYAFPLMGRYESPLGHIIRNSYLLFIMEFKKSLFILVVELLPWAMLLLVPGLFLRLGILWFFLGCTATAYWNDKVILKIFEKHQRKEEAEEG